MKLNEIPTNTCKPQGLGTGRSCVVVQARKHTLLTPIHRTKSFSTVTTSVFHPAISKEFF